MFCFNLFVKNNFSNENINTGIRFFYFPCVFVYRSLDNDNVYTSKLLRNIPHLQEQSIIIYTNLKKVPLHLNDAWIKNVIIYLVKKVVFVIPFTYTLKFSSQFPYRFIFYLNFNCRWGKLYGGQRMQLSCGRGL